MLASSVVVTWWACLSVAVMQHVGVIIVRDVVYALVLGDEVAGGGHWRL